MPLLGAERVVANPKPEAKAVICVVSDPYARPFGVYRTLAQKNGAPGNFICLARCPDRELAQNQTLRQSVLGRWSLKSDNSFWPCLDRTHITQVLC